MEEIWKDVEGFDYKYQISNLGNFRCLNSIHKNHRGIIKKGSLDSYGYYRVNLTKDGKNMCVKTHRLVAKYFLEDYSDDLPVNHKDLNKQNNRVDNLEMVTYKENTHHYHNEIGNNNIGVKKHKNLNKWTVRVTYLGERVYLGTFETEQEAIDRLNKWELTKDVSLFKIGKGKSTLGKTKYTRKDIIRMLNDLDERGFRAVIKDNNIWSNYLTLWKTQEENEMKNLKRIHHKILEWGYNKGIIENSSPIKQWEKTMEEVEELRVAIEKNDKDEIKDAIADSIITLMLQAEINGLSLEECLESAYNIISKRKGKIVNGIFVKDE